MEAVEDVGLGRLETTLQNVAGDRREFVDGPLQVAVAVKIGAGVERRPECDLHPGEEFGDIDAAVVVAVPDTRRLRPRGGRQGGK